MDALIFIDTNILLDFYRVRSGGVGLELLELIDKHKDLVITGSQVEMEYKKNRQAVIIEGLKQVKAPDWGSLALPSFLADSRPKKNIELCLGRDESCTNRRAGTFPESVQRAAGIDQFQCSSADNPL